MRVLCMLLLSTLFGLRNPGDGGRQLVTIDPASAAVASLSASINPPNGTPGGVIALDRGGDRVFFAGTPGAETTPRLYAVSTASGNVLGSPAIEGGTSIHGLEYDEAEDVLYALRSPASSSGKQLVRLDAATGVATAVSAPSAAIGLPSGVTALDASGNRFFFIGTPDGESGQRLYTISTAGGATISSPSVDASAAVIGLEYDEVDNILYGLRTPAGGGKQLVTLNPATGAAVALGPTIGTNLGISNGLTAIDGGGNRFFFIATPSGEADARIYTVNTSTGSVVGSPTIAGSATQFFQGLAFEASGPPPVLTVSIDVVPPKINPRSTGIIPVVILTTPAFDASTVDVSTVRFGPGNTGEIHRKGHLADHDKDGDQDLLLHFGTPLAAIRCGATYLSLTGQTRSGQLITGADSIQTTGCR